MRRQTVARLYGLHDKPKTCRLLVVVRRSQDARRRLREAYRNVADRYDDRSLLDYDSWWRDPEILKTLGPLLAEPFTSAAPTVVLGPAASGYLLGPLAALALDVGFVAVTKDPRTSVDSDAWRVRTTPPDYQDRHLELGFRRRLLTSADRVVAVDDLVDTASQLLIIKALVLDAGATWLGASVLIDNLRHAQPRRQLNLHAVLHVRDL